MRKRSIWVQTRSNTNRPVQSQEQARSLKFWIQEEERLYYPCKENKGADQLCSYCEANLRLCFRLCRLLVFSCGSSFMFIVSVNSVVLPIFVLDDASYMAALHLSLHVQSKIN